MLRRVTRTLVAILVALGLTMPAVAHAMPMPAAVMGMVPAVDQPCQHCPQPHQTGSTAPDKMQACQVLACINAPAILPGPMLLPGRVLLGVPYGSPVATRLIGAASAPDPFPPRPVILS
jgi:hypothetical protein